MSTIATSNLFVIGQWVRGKNFFGRENLIAELLAGPRQAVWVAALRRMGKTSLLREIERRVLEDQQTAFLPLYWNFEGAMDGATLCESLLASLDETASSLRPEASWEDLSTPELLRKLQQTARKNSKTLLLLCDEVEALLAVAKNDPHLLARLRRALQGSEHVRCILTATRRLSKLETFDLVETSPFLHGFAPPLYLSPLSETEAESLLALAEFPPDDVKSLYRLTGGYPFLLQLLAKRAAEMGSIAQAFETLQDDETLHNFFMVDYNTLQPAEQALLRRCRTEYPPVATMVDTTGERVARQTLLALGLIMTENGALRLRVPLFETWLSAIPDENAPTETPSATPAAHVLRPGDRVGPYQILHEIARGGMGVVYCGRDVHLQRLAAIKVISPELVSDATQRVRLLTEARAISQLQHPNIATIYSVEFLGEAPCLCMEYIDGQRLDQWAQQPERGFSQKMEIIRQFASALAVAHMAHIIHRDLKPGNMLVRHDGLAKLVDFGIARHLSARTRLTKTGQTPGTLAYMSPEQVSNVEGDARSDVFSFGVVLYELFCGRRPFQGDNELALAYAIVNETPEAPGKLHPELSADMQALIVRALSKNPAERFVDGGELLLALKKI